MNEKLRRVNKKYYSLLDHDDIYVSKHLNLGVIKKLRYQKREAHYDIRVKRRE